MKFFFLINFKNLDSKRLSFKIESFQIGVNVLYIMFVCVWKYQNTQ
jgi:hypothetical protein